MSCQVAMLEEIPYARVFLCRAEARRYSSVCAADKSLTARFYHSLVLQHAESVTITSLSWSFRSCLSNCTAPPSALSCSLPPSAPHANASDPAHCSGLGGSACCEQPGSSIPARPEPFPIATPSYATTRCLSHFFLCTATTTLCHHHGLGQVIAASGQTQPEVSPDHEHVVPLSAALPCMDLTPLSI